jgi:hypothetical protein
MMPTRVALFPYDEDVARTSGFLNELMLVTSALQIQVSRDVAPFWNVSAVVSAFSSIDLIPDGYLPIGITSGSLPLNRSGFHYTEAGQPSALIEYCGDWSSSASHELIEMLCDPSGTKTVTARSLGDQKNDAGGSPVIANVAGPYQEQGQVAYVMEVCDPVEQSTYTIGTVNVSDFVTPDFYGPLQPPDSFTRYSFTERVTAPLEILEGGYITWASRGPNAYVFQAFGKRGRKRGGPVPPSDLEITRIGAAPQVLSRSWIDANGQAKQDEKQAPCGSLQHYVVPKPAAPAAGRRAQIGAANDASNAPTDLDRMLDLVQKFQETTFRTDFQNDPTATLESVGITAPSGFPPKGTPLGWKLPDPELYQTLQTQLEQGHRVGYSFGDPAFLPWLAKFPGG